MRRRSNATVALRAGGPAGVVAAIIMDAYRLGVGYFTHRAIPEDHYRYVASAILGPAAYALPGAAWFGVALHLMIGLVWGVAFASAALHTAALYERPITSGAVFGSIVYVVMRVVTAAGGIARPATPGVAFFEWVAHTVFFGIPLAVIVAHRRPV
ncbi:MAG: hypothetical protein JO060_05065 [Candidatus Eremiobacteraeota bacterium]|nr:hypothetical protein [Candidatus Eremiobacteraeota bacterium]MBV9647108.1 hypothetical protein [Candidatus Eremiobacteraeota bacterium]